MKRRQFLFTVIVLTFGIAVINGQSKETNTNIVSAEENDVEESDFAIDKKGVLTEYYGTDENVIIPDGVTEIGDYVFSGKDFSSILLPDSVTIIGEGVFSGCNKLTTITIPDSVTIIGEDAFSGCSSLNEIILPDTITEIGDRTFADCSNLKEIIIPENIIKIGDYAFSGCSSLTEIMIPNKVTTIGWSAFNNCKKLLSVTISDTVEELGTMPFSGCSSLEKIIVDFNNKNYEIRENVLFKKEDFGLQLVAYPPKRKGKKYNIPEEVVSIESSAFKDCKKLEKIVLSDNITTIGYNAFSNCKKLIDITIPNNMTEIRYEKGSFYGGKNLKNLNITMKKGDKISFVVVLGEGSELYRPTITYKNEKRIARQGNILDKEIITAKKKGKARIVFKYSESKTVVTLTIK